MRHRQAEHTLISEVMHKHTYRVTEHQTIAELVSLFVDKGINAAPVVNENDRPIGFVSKTDIIREIREQRSAQHVETEHQVQPWWDADRLAQLKVGEIMTATLYTFSMQTTLADAIAAMAFEGIHHIPVVADSGKLTGMLSALDVLDWLARNAGYKRSDGQKGQVFERLS